MATRLDLPREPQQIFDPAELGSRAAASQHVKRPAAWRRGAMTIKRHFLAALLMLILGCLAGVGWLIYSNQRAEMESERGERHTREVIRQWGDLLSSLKDAETGQRGFIITGEPAYLKPYQDSLSGIATGLASLRRLTADNPQQQQQLDALAPLVAAKLADLKETIALRESQGFPVASAAVATQSGRKMMDEIRALVAQAQAQEAQLLKERIATHAADNRKTMQSVVLGSALTGLALLLLFIRIRGELAGRQRAETLSRADEQQLRLATDAAELGIWIWQPDGDRISWQNDRPYAIFGMPHTDAPLTAARFAAEFVHPEDFAALERAIADTVRSGARLFFQGRFHCPDGALRWVEFTGRPVPGTEGSSLRVIGTVQDITRRKQAEELVARQAAELATLYGTAPVGLFFFDTDLRYVRVNPAMAELNGLPAELHIGRTLRELLTPELADAVEPQVRLVLETGRPLLNCEVRGATASRPGEQQRHWLVSYYPVQAADGTIRGVQGAMQEITERKQADETLRESEQRFRALVLASSDLMCRMSPDWSEMRQIYDKDFVVNTQVPNPNWLETYIYREDQPRLMALAHEAIRTKRLFEMEHRVRRADGSWGWMSSRAVPLLDARGEIVEWFGAGSDVTEKKQAEQALRESERFLRSSLDALSGHIAVLDESGTILEINEAWQRFGNENQARASGIGVGVNYLQHCEQSLSQDEPIPAYVRGIKDVMAGRQTRFEMEYPCHSPTEQRWFVMQVTRFQNPGPVRIVIEHDNCTERKLAEDALRQSEERLRLAADAAHFGMYDRDLGGGYFHISTQIRQMLGYEPDAPLDHAQLMLHFHPDDQEAGLAAFQRACDPAGDGRIAIEQRIVRRDGVVRWISSVGRVLFEDGVPKRSIGFLVDITERKRLERKSLEQAQALADLDRRKDEFLAMLSHELRNPLAAISNAVQLLRLLKEEGPIQVQARSIIERQVGHLTHLVDDLLEVSRINTGRVRLRQEPVSVSGIVERAVETAQPLITQRRHQLTVSLPPQPIFLQADAARLEQVLVNLLTNAAKYTDEGGRIWLSVEADKAAGVAADGAAAVPMVLIHVRDTGIGIAPELLPHIFDLFTQADRSLDRSQGGLGIGLCLVQRLVEMHGGTVEAHSVLGQGSEFVVRLPVMPTALPALPSPAHEPADKTRPLSATGCRVLVVDDNVDAAQGLARLLEMIGHEFRLVYDGPSVLAAVMEYRPDVVLLDIGLPGLDGYEVAQQIRQQATLGHIVLVAVTGYGQEADRQLSKEAGFDYHLVKPASVDQIEKILLSVSERVK